MTIEPLHPEFEKTADIAAKLSTGLARTIARFEFNNDRPPTGAAWVVFDDQGSAITGWSLGDQPMVQAKLALAGAMLLADAVRDD